MVSAENEKTEFPGCRPEVGARYVRWLFLRALGATYLLAFVSLWAQVTRLMGAEGLLPAVERVDSVRVAGLGFLELPTLLWLGSSDLVLHLICGAGVVFAVLLISGFLAGPLCLVLWFLYLSLLHGGSLFMLYSFDLLLLETGFLAAFAAPWSFREDLEKQAPSQIQIWALRFLACRVMIGAGLIKLASGDPAWPGLTALHYLSFTQPLPSPAGWFLHQLPSSIHAVTCAVVLAVEILLPVLVVFGSRARWATFIGLAALQIGFFPTGNYGYMNIITFALCLVILDDRHLPQRLRSWIGRVAAPRRGLRSGRDAPAAPLAVACLLLAGLGFFRLVQVMPNGPSMIPGPAAALLNFTAPFRVANAYDFFSTVKTQRLEVVIEVRADEGEWREIPFRWKPSRTEGLPRQVAPHTPRLDLLIWFIGPSHLRHRHKNHAFFERLMRKVLERSPSVLSLLDENALPTELFEGDSRLQIRASLYDYTFSSLGRFIETGRGWERAYLGEYLPARTLDELRDADRGSAGTPLLPVRFPIPLPR